MIVFMNGESWIKDSLDSFKHASFMNEPLLCLLLEKRCGSAVALFGTIFLDEMAQNQAVVLYSDK